MKSRGRGRSLQYSVAEGPKISTLRYLDPVNRNWNKNGLMPGSAERCERTGQLAGQHIVKQCLPGGACANWEQASMEELGADDQSVNRNLGVHSRLDEQPRKRGVRGEFEVAKESGLTLTR